MPKNYPTMNPLRTTLTAFLILSLVSPDSNAQIPWDIEIIKSEAIGREPGFTYSFSPINTPNYFQLGRVTVEQANGQRTSLLKMLDYKTMKVTSLIVPMDRADMAGLLQRFESHAPGAAEPNRYAVDA